jgi:hypothetical protein
VQSPSLQRRLIGVYVDYLVFSALWMPLAYGLRAQVPALGRWSTILVTFTLLEVLAFVRPGATPGSWALGIRRGAEGVYVGASWRARERWWTLLVGVLGLSEGAKEIVRFTQGLPPPPFMGLDLTWDQAAAVVTLSGVLYLITGIGVLCTSTGAAAFGVVLCSASLVSWLASFEQVPAWAEARTLARRAAQGMVAHPEEIAFMQKVLPGGALLAGVVSALWLFVAVRHFRACDHHDARRLRAEREPHSAAGSLAGK